LPTEAGNIIWDCVSLVTHEAPTELKARGGVGKIIISHPHFYSSTLWAVPPFLIHEADRECVGRPSPSIQFWSGDKYRLSDALTLIRCGGHFPGSTAIHWRDGRAPAAPCFQATRCRSYWIVAT
jgi:glyoxylase-like metal-dependent hydrolase (beta-lactamase superfamily II)